MTNIESPYAMTALRKMAETTPKRLLQMQEDSPLVLLKEIETRVTNALGWAETAMGKGASRQKIEETIELLLKPDPTAEQPSQMVVTEQKINEIYQMLVALAK